MATLKAFNASRRRDVELHERAEAFCRDSIRVMIAWCLSAGVAELAISIGTAAAVGLDRDRDLPLARHRIILRGSGP